MDPPGSKRMWHRQIEWIEPMEAATRLRDLPGLAMLDSAMPHPTLGRYSVVGADPFGVFRVRDGVALWNGIAETAAPLAALRARLDACRLDPIAGLPPFQGGAIGTFAYEFGWTLEGREPPAARDGDDVHVGFHDVVVAFDHVCRRSWIIASGLPERDLAAREARAVARLDAFASRLARRDEIEEPFDGTIVWQPTITRNAYRERVERVRTYIRAGDIYQANIAQRFIADAPPGIDPLRLYAVLRIANPAPFAAFLEQGDRFVLSTSPELFLRTRGRRVETRPIKGTARRLSDTDADRRARAALHESRKDRAENVMIVDLLRNDLSRVCDSGSVEVPVLCDVESYAGLHHLVSAVTGTLAEGRDALDLVEASFPGGSITGAPKLRAMEIIAELEGASRGIYCGAIGVLGFDGSVDLSIAIRTVVIDGGTMELRAGGGITLLSDPDREYEETLVKAGRIFDAFAGTSVLAEADA